MRQVIVVGLLLAVSFSCAIGFSQVLSRQEVSEVVGSIPGERQLREVIEVGPDTKLKADIEVTTKGNGTLTVANLRLRVIDEHDDGAVYQDGMAHVEFVDVNGDDWKDIVIVGIVNYTNEKNDSVVLREPFTFMYVFVPTSKTFSQVYKHAKFDLKDGPQPRR